MAIKCCNGCVPPKRNLTCHGTCPDYIREKAVHDAQMAEENRKRSIKQGLNDETFRGVQRATKGKRKCKEESQ